MENAARIEIIKIVIFLLCPLCPLSLLLYLSMVRMIFKIFVFVTRVGVESILHVLDPCQFLLGIFFVNLCLERVFLRQCIFIFKANCMYCLLQPRYFNSNVSRLNQHNITHVITTLTYSHPSIVPFRLHQIQDVVHYTVAHIPKVRNVPDHVATLLEIPVVIITEVFLQRDVDLGVLLFGLDQEIFGHRCHLAVVSCPDGCSPAKIRDKGYLSKVVSFVQKFDKLFGLGHANEVFLLLYNLRN